MWFYVQMFGYADDSVNVRHILSFVSLGLLFAQFIVSSAKDGGGNSLAPFKKWNSNDKHLLFVLECSTATQCCVYCEYRLSGTHVTFIYFFFALQKRYSIRKIIGGSLIKKNTFSMDLWRMSWFDS